MSAPQMSEFERIIAKLIYSYGTAPTLAEVQDIAGQTYDHAVVLIECLLLRNLQRAAQKKLPKGKF